MEFQCLEICREEMCISVLFCFLQIWSSVFSWFVCIFYCHFTEFTVVYIWLSWRETWGLSLVVWAMCKLGLHFASHLTNWLEDQIQHHVWQWFPIILASSPNNKVCNLCAHVAYIWSRFWPVEPNGDYSFSECFICILLQSSKAKTF